MKCRIIKTDGTIIKVQNKDKEASLEFLQKSVGGYIEVVTLQDDHYMVLNEEGKLLKLPYNEKATQIFMANTKILDDIIVGDVVIIQAKYLK